MHRSTRTLGRLAATAAIAGVVLAATASSALAGPLGNWSVAGPYTQTGTLTLSVAGEPSKTCQYSATLTTNPIATYGDTDWESCTPGSTMRLVTFQTPLWNAGNTKVRIANGGASLSPWGTWGIPATDVPVVNGNATTPTRIVFNNTLLGNTGPYPNRDVRATGNLTITTATGGLVTVTP